MEKLKLKKAWIVRWFFNGSGEKKQLKRYGLTNNVIDFLSDRNDFDRHVRPYAENLYKQRLLSLSEKFHLAHYNKRKARDQMFGSAVPVKTHYSSVYYRKMQDCWKSDRKDDPECIVLHENWENYPMYVIVGHNPSVEIKKVFNLELVILDGKVSLLWEEPLADGTLEKNTQESINFIRERF